jgi:hypothetical protein|nr:MAG TPA: zinc-ribbon containing domain protein [Bacteriophage sp.]
MIKRKNGTLHWLDLDITQSPWSVIRCPHCGYRIKLCSMCDVRDGGKCDWNPDNETCKHDLIGIYEGFDRNMSDVEKEENYDRK